MMNPQDIAVHIARIEEVLRTKPTATADDRIAANIPEIVWANSGQIEEDTAIQLYMLS